MAKIITNNLVSSLDFTAEFDLCNGKITVTPALVFSGGVPVYAGAVLLSAKDPGGVVSELSSLFANNSYGSVQFDIGKIGGVYKNGTYEITLSLTPPGGTAIPYIKWQIIETPLSNNNIGVVGFKITPNCKSGKVVVGGLTIPLYQGLAAVQYTQLWKYYFPNGSEQIDITSTFSPFEAQAYNGQNEARATICAIYNTGDGISVKVAYAGTVVKRVACGVELCYAYAAIHNLYDQISDCSRDTREAIEQKITQASNLILLIQLGLDCNYDVSDDVEALENVLGTSICGNGPDETTIAGIPAESIVIEGCGFTQEQAGLTTRFTINNYTYNITNSGDQGVVTRTNTLNGCVSATNFAFNWDKLTDLVLAYMAGTKNGAFLTLLNTALAAVNPKCVTTVPTWAAASFSGKIQLIIDKICVGQSGGGGLTVTPNCAGATVAGTITSGTPGTVTITLPITVVGTGTIFGSVTGTNLSGTIANTDVTAATTQLIITVAYDSYGDGGTRNATVSLSVNGAVVTCVVPISIIGIVGCSAPINPSVAIAGNTVTVSFSPAVSQPATYTVKRRRASDADSDVNYLTLTAPVFNGGLGLWQTTENFTSNEVNKVWVYKIISNCVGSTPSVTTTFCAQTCVVNTVTPTDSTLTYSFTPIGADTITHRIKLFLGGVFVNGSERIVPLAFPNPIVGSYTGLLPNTAYEIRVYVDANSGAFNQSLECITAVTTSNSPAATITRISGNRPVTQGSPSFVGRINGTPGTTVSVTISTSGTVPTDTMSYGLTPGGTGLVTNATPYTAVLTIPPSGYIDVSLLAFFTSPTQSGNITI